MLTVDGVFVALGIGDIVRVRGHERNDQDIAVDVSRRRFQEWARDVAALFDQKAEDGSDVDGRAELGDTHDVSIAAAYAKKRLIIDAFDQVGGDISPGIVAPYTQAKAFAISLIATFGRPPA